MTGDQLVLSQSNPLELPRVFLGGKSAPSYVHNAPDL
jgi:hypothetical protein